MAWFKVDDHFWGHPKRLACTLTEIGLWVTAGSWSAQQQTDGFVPRHVLPVLGGKPKDAAGLVGAGLWLEADGGWLFHDWNAFQPTKQQLEDKRQEEAARKQAWRDAKAAKAKGTADVPPSVPQMSHGTPASQPPPCPVPVPTSSALARTRPEPDPTRPGSSLREEQHQQTKSLARLASSEFDDWWEVYPRKVSKKAAREQYRIARKEASTAELLAGAVRYRDDPTRGATCHPTTWLHQGRWADESPAQTQLTVVRPDNRRSGDDAAREAHEVGMAWLAKKAAQQMELGA